MVTILCQIGVITVACCHRLRRSERIQSPSYRARTTWRLPEIVSGVAPSSGSTRQHHHSSSNAPSTVASSTTSRRKDHHMSSSFNVSLAMNLERC
ncbi:hypothetical protein BDZ97DRAFT_1831373 [Flammula alnicola]|nr:hypothetical protein BDZ97DRAFT_1831373 [Flammula alnicola]